MDINQNIQLALQHYQSGNLQQAEDICRKIAQRQPNNVAVLNFLGAIHYQRENYDSAMGYFKKALRINPHFVEAHNNLGNVLKEKGRIDEAIASYKKAIGLNAAFVLAYNGLGAALQKKGCIDDAIIYFQKALQLNPNYAEAYNNLGTAFREKGNIDEAIVCFQKALLHNPRIPDVYNNLGTAFRDKRRLDDAIVYFQKALQINPSFAGAFYNLGNVFEEKALYDDAITCYREALRLNPDQAEVYNNLGNAHKGEGLIDDAIRYYQKAVQLNPGYAEAYNNLGLALQDQGKLEEAEEYYRRALQIKPDFAACYSNLLLLMNYSSRHTPEAVFAEHLQFARQCAAPLSSSVLPHTNDRSPSRRLKIGYVSPDFRRHSVNYFLEPVLASHTHEHYEVFCYSDVLVPDKVTERLQGYSDQWRNIAGMPDEQAAELIRRDGIDILIDLAGHTSYGRMLLFARKPAPVQVSWLGYPNTTGLSTIDYRIVDGYTDPPGLTEPFYTEALERLSGCFLCYMPNWDSPEAGTLPALTSGQVTFGSFNNLSKVSPEVIRLWAGILRRIPGSRVILKAKGLSDGPACHSVMETFMREGIIAGRIELLPWNASTKVHLDTYSHIDIGLDTFPYNGTTTTCEALWMGVPVITLAGNTHASRVGTSLLSNIGLPELIAETEEQYVDIAVNLAADVPRLQALRGSLREMMEQSPLTDTKRFTGSMENCYRIMWKKWCTSA